MKTERRFSKTLFITMALCLTMLLAGCAGSSNSFDIVGSWKVTSGSFGQANPGAVIVFGDNGKCTLYSPADNYSFSDGELHITGVLGGNFTFQVTITDKDHITLVKDTTKIVLVRSTK